MMRPVGQHLCCTNCYFVMGLMLCFVVLSLHFKHDVLNCISGKSAGELSRTFCHCTSLQLVTLTERKYSKEKRYYDS